MTEKFTVEDEHRPNVRTYRLLIGNRIIAHNVSAEFVDLLASAGVLLAAGERALQLRELECAILTDHKVDFAMRRAWRTEAAETEKELRAAITAAKPKEPEVGSYP